MALFPFLHTLAGSVLVHRVELMAEILSPLPKSHPPYPPEFRRQMVQLVRTGRSPEELAQEFEPTAQAIRNWVQQADRDEGLRHDGLTTDEREELNRLRRKNRQLKQEREILKQETPTAISYTFTLN
jgi:transposase